MKAVKVTVIIVIGLVLSYLAFCAIYTFITHTKTRHSEDKYLEMSITQNDAPLNFTDSQKDCYIVQYNLYVAKESNNIIMEGKNGEILRTYTVIIALSKDTKLAQEIIEALEKANDDFIVKYGSIPK